MASIEQLSHKSVELGLVNVSYVEAGNPDLPTLLLLHGFPSSYSQYRTLIPLLASSYHVLSLSFPGFGTTVTSANYEYTFANMANVVGSFLTALKIASYAVYIFDYGAPAFLRLALNQPAGTSVKAIISQNGNAYVEGFGADFWAPIYNQWNTSDSEAAREVIRKEVLTLAGVEFQYRQGVPAGKQALIPPADYTYDYLVNVAPSSGRQDIQLDYFYDYRTNVEMYPKFQEWFRQTQIPLFAIWGKGDPAFIPAGAEAFKRDLPNARVRFLDTGHFAVTTDAEVIATEVKSFLTGVSFL